MNSRDGRRFSSSGFLGKLFPLTLLALLLANHLVYGAPSPPAKKVLLLYAYPAMMPAIFEWDGAIRAALQDTETQTIEIYTEFLNLVSFPDESYVPSLLNYLKKKYENQKIDLLMPVGSLTVSFIRDYGKSLFPGIPMVFCNATKQQVEALEPLLNFTGVMMWLDVQGTLEAALKLQPDTRRVVLVGGTAKDDRFFLQLAREVLRPYEDRFEIILLTGQPLPEILKQLANLPPQTLIIYLSMFRDSTGHIFVPREVSGRVARVAKRPDLFRKIIVPEDRDLWDTHERNALEKPEVRKGQFRVQRPDGTIRWIDYTCQPVSDDAGRFVGIRGSNRDITERKQAEIQEQQHREDLARVGRIATLSELTGSLAHEIMQPLMAIMNNSQAARRLLDNADPDLDEVIKIIDDITKGSERASGVIHQLRQHLKPGPPELTQLDVNDLVQSLIPLVDRQAAINHINLGSQLTKGLPPINGNRIQLEQVILNLVVNSIEAIKEMAGGAREIILQTNREDEHTLRVSVLDTGPGVKPEDLQPLFDPFFTTKKEGMGLGLSISRSIIKAHRGRLWAAPNPGGGTALYITLPVSQESDEKGS